MIQSKSFKYIRNEYSLFGSHFSSCRYIFVPTAAKQKYNKIYLFSYLSELMFNINIIAN